jgi:hypothetical protein
MDHGLSSLNMQADLGNMAIRSREKVKRLQRKDAENRKGRKEKRKVKI